MISSPIFCMYNQTLVNVTAQPNSPVVSAQQLAHFSTQTRTIAAPVAVAPSSKSNRVCLNKCGGSSPEQISWAINEFFLRIKKDEPMYSARVYVNTILALANKKADYARQALSYFNKDYSGLHNAECIDAVRAHNKYFEGLISIILVDFHDQIRNVNGCTLDSLLLGRANEQKMHPIIADYIQNKLSEHYLTPVNKNATSIIQQFILGGQRGIYAKELYGQGYEVTAKSIRISNDGRYVKATDDVKGQRELIWDINTGERAYILPPQTYWSPWQCITDCATTHNCVVSESDNFMAVAVKDKKIEYQGIEKDYSHDKDVPALVIAVTPTWREEIIYGALRGSNSIEQLQALLKSRSLRLMRPFVRKNLKDFVVNLLESAEEDAEIVQ